MSQLTNLNVSISNIYIYISDQQHSFFAVHCFWIHHSWNSISRKVVIKETPLREVQDDLLRCWVVEGWVDLSGTRIKASLIHVIRSAALLFCRPLFFGFITAGTRSQGRWSSKKHRWERSRTIYPFFPPAPLIGLFTLKRSQTRPLVVFLHSSWKLTFVRFQ